MAQFIASGYNDHHMLLNNRKDNVLSCSFNVGSPSASSVGSSSPVSATQQHINGWTPEEQSLLELGLDKFAKEPVVTRYAKIAILLKNKTIRDVASQVKWMSEKVSIPSAAMPSHFAAQSPAAVMPSHFAAQSPAATPSHFAVRSNVSLPVLAMATMNIDDGISIRAAKGVNVIMEQLEQNAHALSQMSRNLASHQLQGNIILFCQTRKNLIEIVNELNDMDWRRQMPPIPVKLYEIKPVLRNRGMILDVTSEMKLMQPRYKRLHGSSSKPSH